MSRWARRFRRRQYLKGSLWVLPLCGGVIGVLLAQLALWLDSSVHIKAFWHYSASTATGVLTAIIGAMVALLGFVVTIGVLVIQQATATLSPRFMRLWYRDLLQKAVLATFAGTLTYAFALLRRIEADFVPDLGVTLAGIAVGISLMLLLIYLNRFTHALRPVAVAAIVERAGERVLAQWRTITAGHDPQSDIDIGNGAGAVLMPAVVSERAGAIQAIDVNGLVAAAAQHDCLLIMTHTVGDFVVPGDNLAEIRRTGAAPRSQPPPEQLRGRVALGVERTLEQDPAFALRILVDIAIKALSPAINDPTTAVQVLDYIETYLHRLGVLDLRHRYTIADAHGTPRVVLPGRSWEDYLELAVTEVRSYGANSLQVCRRLRALLNDVEATVPPERREAIEVQLSLLDETIGRNFRDDPSRAAARVSDRQGIGGAARNWEPRFVRQA